MTYIFDQYTFLDLLKDYSYVPAGKKNVADHIKESLVLLLQEVKTELNDMKELITYLLSLEVSENHFMALLKDHNLVPTDKKQFLYHSNDNWLLENDEVYKAS